MDFNHNEYEYTAFAETYPDLLEKIYDIEEIIIQCEYNNKSIIEYILMAKPLGYKSPLEYYQVVYTKKPIENIM